MSLRKASEIGHNDRALTLGIYRWLVRLGVQNVDRQSRPEDIYSIRATYSHPDYDDSSVNRGSDIALLELDRDIVFHGTN